MDVSTSQDEPDRPLETGWLPDTPVGDSLLRQFTFNQADLNAFVGTTLGGKSEVDDDVHLATTASSPLAYYNQAIPRRPITGSDDQVLDRIEAFYAGGPPATLLSVWPTPDLRARGWVLVGHPMFVARPAGPIQVPRRQGVRVEAVTDDQSMASFERVVVEAYPIEEARGLPAGQVLPGSLLGGPLCPYIGLRDEVPVGAGARHVGHGVVNLCLAATLPAGRRQGVWRALVAARTADHPDLPVVAFTSDDSRPGFIRLGFLPIIRFTMWLIR